MEDSRVEHPVCEYKYLGRVIDQNSAYETIIQSGKAIRNREDNRVVGTLYYSVRKVTDLISLPKTWWISMKRACMRRP